MAEGQPSPGTLLPLALVQLQPGADPATNRRAAEAWLERASAEAEAHKKQAAEVAATSATQLRDAEAVWARRL